MAERTWFHSFSTSGQETDQVYSFNPGAHIAVDASKLHGSQIVLVTNAQS